MKVCRVCLAMGEKMYHMSEHNLSVMYEQVAGLKINTEDMLPKMLCWECVARMSSAYNFMKKALKTHFILEDKIKNSRFISMGYIDSIDKTELKSSLGVKLYKDNYSDIHIVKESDNSYEDSKAELSEPNFVDIKNEEEQLFVIQDIASINKDLIKREYSDGNEEQTFEYENNIKFQNTEFKTEMLEISVTENASDEEMVFDNESKVTEMFKEENHIKVETTEVYDFIKLNQMRKRSEALPHCKEPKVVLDNIILSLNEHNTQDNCKYLTSNAQSAKDNIGAFFLGNSSISDPVSVRTSFSDAVSSNKLLIYDKSLRNDKHTSNSVFTCNYCTFETSVKTRLTYHTNSKHPKRSFNCAHCDFVTNVKSILVRHINAKHTKKIVNCSYCSYNTYIKAKLDKHMNSKHTKNNNFNCTYCNYKTYVKCKLNAHVNVKHTKTDVFKCSFCNYEAYNKNTLKRHVNTKHTKTNVFACSYCSFKAYEQHNLNRHVNAKHTKDLSFNCSLCNYKTYNKDLLKGHINAKHTKTDVFKCSFCNHETYNKRHLKDHINAKHTKVNAFTCPYCSFKSFQKSNLNIHVNIKHTKTKVFLCSFCNYKAYNKRSLKDHINGKHTKLNLFICSYCNLQVSYKSTLIAHIKAKHS